MKIKLKSKLWVWLHCKRDSWDSGVMRYKKYGNEQVYLYPSVLSHADETVDADLVDKDALDFPADAAYMINVNKHSYWVPNWFISEVFN